MPVPVVEKKISSTFGTKPLWSTDTVAVEEVAASSTGTSAFEKFDYNAHWYPVIWACDLILNEPTKVTVFDVDYVVARISDTEVIAMEDKCPHKAAALSQGRVTSSGYFQCSYHGWSFNGTDGSCVEIPQIVRAEDKFSPVFPSKSCGKAVPAMIHQDMVWLFPGGGLEKALSTSPPTVEEYDIPGFGATRSARDFPLDWPVLLSNICDPDHGLFVHQSKNFDAYTASKDFPMDITEEFIMDGQGWTLQTVVDASQKLISTFRKMKGESDDDISGINNKKKKQKVKVPQKMFATTYMHFPTHVKMKRVVEETNSTNFAALFYVCPVGVGRSRFFSAGLSKFPPKRWQTKLFLDNFLDQDTYLLATQQQYILTEEANDIRQLLDKSNSDDFSSIERQVMPTRRRMFCLASPTEKSASKIEQFWDATLLRSPNRIKNLLRLDDAGTFRQTPSREYVLDRKTQVLDISPQAQDTVENCEKIIRRSRNFSIILLLAKVAATSFPKLQRLDRFLQPSTMVVPLGVAAFASWMAEKVRREYYFKYTEKYRQRDLKKIPEQIWLDKE